MNISIGSLLLVNTCLFVLTRGVSALHIIINHPISCKRKHEDALTFLLSSHRSGSPPLRRDKIILFSKINGGNNIGPAENYLSMINGNPVDQQHQQHLEDSTSNVNGYSSSNVNGSNNERDSKILVEDTMIPLSTQPAYDLALHDDVRKPTSESIGKEQPLNEAILSEEELLESREIMNATSAILTPNDSSQSVDQQEAFVSNLIRNFWTSKDSSNDEKDRAEESRRWSEWMTTGKKTRPSISRDLLDDAPAAKEKNQSADNVESTNVANVSDETSEKTKSPTKMLSKFKQEQMQRKQEQKEKRQIEDRQKQREERQYREQREKDPGRVSASDWSHNIRNIFYSRILRDISSPVVWTSTWATFWSVIYRCLTAANESNRENIADWSHRIASSIVIPTTAHSVMVSAMSLLLVFRTNSAYQRFAEGRKIWEDIVSTSRDFSRMIKLYEFAIGTPKSRRIRSLLASFPYLLRHRIRPSLMQMTKVNDQSFVRDPDNSLLLYPDISMKDTDPEMAAIAYDEEETGASRRKTRELCWVDKRTLPWKLLPGTALDLCARAQNRPLWVVDRMAKELCVVEDLQPKFTNRERMALMAYTDKLSRSIGACERIHQTVVPLNYARHALRSVTVWLWTLPFALLKDLGLYTGPIIGIISWILFGVYEIGTRIEDPFQGTLRLSIYCDAIRRDVLADAIVRDTAFNLDEDTPETVTDEDEDATFEFESDSDEYGEADRPPKRKTKNKKEKNWFQPLDSFNIDDKK